MNASNRVYPLSIAEGFQSGDIYVNDGDHIESVFFWHYCGFGYLSGEASDAFLRDVYEEMASEKKSRRLVLISNDEKVIRFFRQKNARLDSRIEYAYQGKIQEPAAFKKEKFSVEEIDGDSISRIEGRIIPAFSWESAEQFLKNGFGYIAVQGETVCAVAFSAAVSSEEIDIGVETREEYRRNGLACALAGKMCERIAAIGKKPVWAHAASNIGSMNTALGCGFIKVKRNTFIQCGR